MELIERAIEHASRAAGLRAESVKLADAAEFHAAVSRAYLRDVAAYQRAADLDAEEGDLP